MKKILAFAGSNHAQSINHQLVTFTASIITDCEVHVLDIRDWEIPMYSINLDPDQTPAEITQLVSLIKESDGFIISSPEHNGGPSAFLKNIIDWLSRRGQKVFDDKPVFLMSTSTGQGAGASHLDYLKMALPYQAASMAGAYSLPSFQNHMQDGKLTGEQLEKLKLSVQEFVKRLV